MSHSRTAGVNIEGTLIGVIMVIALVIALYAILPTFFTSTNTTAVDALGAPTGAVGIFNAVPVLAGVLFALAVLLLVIRVAIRGKSR